MTEDRNQLLRLTEAILFASKEPVSETALAARLPEDSDVKELLAELASLYENRGINLVHPGGSWAFRTAPDLAGKLEIERETSRRLSRAGVETLAIIAYHQPITRAEIEDIRGVAVNRGTLDVLLECGWIKPGRRRETPGRPVTWVSTTEFLNHFGLENLRDLPGISELREAGLLEKQMSLDVYATRASEVDDSDATDEDAEVTEVLEEIVAADEAGALDETSGVETPAEDLASANASAGANPNS